MPLVEDGEGVLSVGADDCVPITCESEYAIHRSRRPTKGVADNLKAVRRNGKLRALLMSSAYKPGRGSSGFLKTALTRRVCLLCAPS